MVLSQRKAGDPLGCVTWQLIPPSVEEMTDITPDLLHISHLFPPLRNGNVTLRSVSALLFDSIREMRSS
jgi:hypothetical protein